MLLQSYKYPKLQENLSADVVVVGAGIYGLSIAYNLSKQGELMCPRHQPQANHLHSESHVVVMHMVQHRQECSGSGGEVPRSWADRKVGIKQGPA